MIQGSLAAFRSVALGRRLSPSPSRLSSDLQERERKKKKNRKWSAKWLSMLMYINRRHLQLNH